MIAIIPSATLLGVDGHAVAIEVHVSNGIPGFALVGLPDAACREARDRVRSAVLASGLTWPQQRMTVNLAPSDLKKVGAGFDLGIAVGLLVAAGQLPRSSIEGIAFLGELGLDGSVRAVDGIVPLVEAVDAPMVVVPGEAVQQARLIGRRRVYGVDNLRDLVAALAGEGGWSNGPPERELPPPVRSPDLSDVRGQPLARWALEVAAAGGHNLLMNGPPGSGKTMLAQRLPGILPDLGPDEALATTRVHSAAGLLARDAGLVVRPPLRAPHHTASKVALVGGGSSTIRAGEVSLANHGVLFLDEMAEFPRHVLDAMRQPLEEGVVRVSRAGASVVLPSRVLLVGATNPCPCGEGTRPGSCRCSDVARSRYLQRLSGPLLDRFDIRIIVERPDVDQFFETTTAEASAVVAERVLAARERARRRGVACNAELTTSQLADAAPLAPDATVVLRRRMREGRLTGRGLERVRRVALTLADLDGDRPVLRDHHICAALELRPEIQRQDDVQ